MQPTRKTILESTFSKAAELAEYKKECQATNPGNWTSGHMHRFRDYVEMGNNMLGVQAPFDIDRFAEWVKRPLPTDASIGDMAMASGVHSSAMPTPPVYHGDNPASFQFKNAETGEMVSALKPNETFASRSPSEHRLRDEGKSVGDVICAIATGNTDNMGQLSAITGDDSKGGHMTSRELSNRIIDLARNATVVARAGAQFLPMKEGQLDLLRVDSDPVAHWRPEATTIDQSNPAYGLVSLRAKTVGAVLPVSIEFLEDGRNASQMVESQMQAALGQALDLAALNGKGAESEPLGIANHAVNEVSAVGTPDDYSDFTKAVGKILQANYPGEVDALSMILHPRDAETYDGLTDTTGQPLTATSWAAAPKQLYTTSLPTDEGSGADESFALLGDFSQVIVGMRTEGVRLAVLNSGSVTVGGTTVDAASSLQRLIVAFLRADVAVLRPTWFTRLSGITTGA